jgi:hypothetical protein
MPHIDTAMERHYLEKLLKVNAIIQTVSQSLVYIQTLHYANPERIYLKQRLMRKKMSKKCQQKTHDVH